MSAIDELRRLLDERGVKWIEGKAPDTTAWSDGSHVARADGYEGQLLVEMVMTPEQAIAATLGNDGVERTKNGVDERGKCKLPETSIDHGSIEYNGITEWRRCSACGAEVLAYPAHFCPRCGAEVVE